MPAPPKRDSVIAVVIVVVAVLWIIYRMGAYQPGEVAFLGTEAEGPIRGVVSSVSGSSDRKEALVRLDEGGEVRASVPAQCLVLAGYAVTLAESGRSLGPEPKYRIVTAKERE
jgi:hypothetical protein